MKKNNHHPRGLPVAPILAEIDDDDASLSSSNDQVGAVNDRNKTRQRIRISSR
jgi:hypothetical protein